MVRKVASTEDASSSRQGDVSDFNVFVAPLVEEFDAADLRGDILGEDGVVASWTFNLDLAVVRHLLR